MGTYCDRCGAFIPYADVEFCKDGPFIICFACTVKMSEEANMKDIKERMASSKEILNILFKKG